MLIITWKTVKPIVLYSVIITVVSAAIVIAIIVRAPYKSYSWEKNTMEKAAVKLTEEVDKIQEVMFSIEEIPRNMGYILEFSNPSDEHMRILLNALVTSNDEVFGTCIAFEPNSYHKDITYFAPYLYKKNGKLIHADPLDTTINYFSQDWYLLPKTLNRPVWIEPYYDEGSGSGDIIMATFSVPFYSFDGSVETVAGIVAVDISLDWLMKTVLAINVGEESYSILVSENGTVICAPNPQWPYNESLFSLADENDQPVLREIGRGLQRGKTGFVKAGTVDGEKNYWIYYMPIPANKWGILLFIPESAKI